MIVTQDTRRRFRQVAQDIVDAYEAGKKTDPHGLRWARAILRIVGAEPVRQPNTEEVAA